MPTGIQEFKGHMWCLWYLLSQLSFFFCRWWTDLMEVFLNSEDFQNWSYIQQYLLKNFLLFAKTLGSGLPGLCCYNLSNCFFELYEFLVFIVPMVSSASIISSSLPYSSISDCGTFYFNILCFYLPGLIISIIISIKN